MCVLGAEIVLRGSVDGLAALFSGIRFGVGDNLPDLGYATQSRESEERMAKPSPEVERRGEISLGMEVGSVEGEEVGDSAEGGV